MLTYRRLVEAALAVGLVLAASFRGEAAPANLFAPDLRLASSLIASGGGPGNFSTVRAFNTMIGPDALVAEQDKLASIYGRRNAGMFVDTFDFAMADAWRLAGAHDMSMPPPSEADGQTLAAQLVRAGTNADGTFNSAELFIVLMGPVVATQLMADINQRFGPGSALTFTRIGNQFFYDVAQTVGANVKLAPNH
jgi:hypothetical protein